MDASKFFFWNAAANFVADALIYPIDVVRTRMQVQVLFLVFILLLSLSFFLSFFLFLFFIS